MPSPIRVAAIVFVLASVAGVIHVGAHVSPAPQTFEVTNVNDSDVGSLRDAIIKANANPGPDTIVFNIQTGTGARVIFLLAALPEITDPVVIDGTTQPGYTNTPLIELNGAFSQTTNGLVIRAGGSTVRGVAIGRFTDIGIWVRDCDNNVIQANHIGVDTTGNVERRNNRGIVLTNSSNNLLGGTTAGARNVISGNSTAIEISGSSNVIQGNFIGTNVAGTAAISNSSGVRIPFSSSLPSNNNVIGGTSPGAGNLISGNGTGIFADGDGTIIQGNLIGTDFTGSIQLPNGTGIQVSASNTLIGGLTSATRNVISGNGVGIHVGDFGTITPQGTIIQGNLIGLDASGARPLPNVQRGIELDNTNGNTIGGTQPGAANVIAFNNGPGVTVARGSGNSIRGNSIFSNEGLGIDLFTDALMGGVTPNDPTDSDTGGNNLQNFPVITSVVSTNNSTTIQGSLKSTPTTAFQIDFYSNAAVDPSGNGEGAQFFNTTSVNTNANGDATINVTFPVGLPAGRAITATATDPGGNTSEFSAADPTGLLGSTQFGIKSITINEDIGTLNITVLRTGGSSGNLTVDYSTADGSATAGQDYTSTSGTLTFNDGETSKTIQIPILDDATTEPDETFTVALSSSNRESVGSPNFLIVTLKDHTTIPVLSIDPGASVIEGDPGTTKEVLFTVHLSVPTGRTISGKYVTMDFFSSRGTGIRATGGPSCGNPGIDYEAASGMFSFPPGVTTITIPVKVCGDANAEVTEPFVLSLTDVSFGAQGTSGFGNILDDDVFSLVIEESPNPGQVVALDAALGTRDPFLRSQPNLFGGEVQRFTRVVLFAKDLRLDPGESATFVSARFVSNSTSQSFGATAEDVRLVPNTDLTQVEVLLPFFMSPGTYTVTLTYRSMESSNSGTIRIIQ